MLELGTVRREVWLGVAGGGVLLGALVGVLFSGPGAPDRGAADAAPAVAAGGDRAGVAREAGHQPGTGEPTGPGEASAAGDEGALGPVLDALETAHDELHGAAGAGDVKTTDERSLDRALVAGKRHLKILRRFYRKVGGGVFIDGGHLTPVAQALLARLDTLGDEGLNPADYGMPGLGREARRMSGGGGAGVRAPQGAGPAGPVLVRLLRAPELDREDARRRLAAAGGHPTTSHVIATATLLKAAQARASTGEHAALEARLARALLQYVLDMRIYRRAGPFTVTRNEDEFAAYGDRPAKAVSWMVGVVEAAQPRAALNALAPRNPHYQALVEQYKRYRGYVAKGCQDKLAKGARLKEGSRGPAVSALQRRLACEGYYDGVVDGGFSPAVTEAVRSYQRHHQLPATGLVKNMTISSLNVPLAKRAKIIALGLQRMRESRTNDAEPFYVRVNIPAFQLEVIDGAKIVRRHKVIVGTNRLDDDKVRLVQGHINRTKLFKTKIYQVIVNPDWILPKRVEKGEVRAKLAEDPDYLKKHNIRRVTLDDGQVVLIQGRGDLNVLGRVKLLLEASSAIYLHDTNDRSMFRHARRDLSHGCVRVHKAVPFAKWLLAHDGWEEREIDKSFRYETTQRGMNLHHKVDLITEYVTVDVSDEGHVTFYDDIYGYDRDFLQGKLPPQVEARWGSPVLRPGWVPKVPADVVEGWRRAGKPAPRDYKP